MLCYCYAAGLVLVLFSNSLSFLADDGIKTVPSVLLVLEGGPGTVGTIHSAVTGDNPVPVVIVKSSGRAADLFAYALTLSTEILEADEDGVHEGLVQGIETLFQGLNENKLKQVYRQVLECLAFEHMVRTHSTVIHKHFWPFIVAFFLCGKERQQ